MRFYEISSGLRVPVSSEEDDLLQAAIKGRGLEVAQLDERQMELARALIGRDVLLLQERNGRRVLVPNDDVDMWRF